MLSYSPMDAIDFGAFPDHDGHDDWDNRDTYDAQHNGPVDWPILLELELEATPTIEAPSECPICKEAFDDNDTTRKPVTIPCGHQFHTACLAFLFVPVGTTEWNEDYPNGRCPLCRTQLFHLPYKFYSEEMVREREENLRRDYEVVHEQPPIRQHLTPEPSREPSPEPEEVVPRIIQVYSPPREVDRQVEGEEVLSSPVQEIVGYLERGRANEEDFADDNDLQEIAQQNDYPTEHLEDFATNELYHRIRQLEGAAGYYLARACVFWKELGRRIREEEESYTGFTIRRHMDRWMRHNFPLLSAHQKRYVKRVATMVYEVLGRIDDTILELSYGLSTHKLRRLRNHQREELIRYLRNF